MFLVQYFSRNMGKYTIPLSVGIIIMSCSSIFAGVVKVFYLLDIQWNLNIIELLPLVGLIGLPFVCVGAYLKTRDDPGKRRTTILAITMIVIFILTIGSILIFS